MILLISSNSKTADGQIWEATCGKEEKIPMRAMYIYKDDHPTLPAALAGITLIDWTWSNIAKFIDSL